MARVFIDFDGVLVRSQANDKSFLWTKNLERDLGVRPETKEELFAQPRWQNILTGKESFKPHIESVLRSRSLPTTADQFISYWLEHDLNWNEDVLGLLYEIKSMKHEVYLVTNQDAIRTAFLREQRQISKIFNGVFSSVDLGAVKPEREFFEKVISSFDYPDTSIYIDDSEQNLSAAEELGWQGLQFDRDFNPLATVERLRKKVFALLD